MVANVYFDPPLWLQRQAWVLSKVRQENVDSLVDVGCSNGVLLSALMQPPFQLDRFPVARFPALALPQFSDAQGLQSSDQAVRLPKRHWIHYPSDITLSRLVGVDMDRKVLENAKASLSLHGQALVQNHLRFKSLHLKLFHGPIGVENEALHNHDAFVAIEVVEHLYEDALNQFTPTVFGKYRPRVVLISTPNYCFNQHFGIDLDSRPGYPDPTGRTSRVFRHDDHKFEWTPQEFNRWCQKVADDYGYQVTVQGIGEGIFRKQAASAAATATDMTGSSKTIPSNPNKKARRPRTTDHPDENLRYASQAALFVRHSAVPAPAPSQASVIANQTIQHSGSMDPNSKSLHATQGNSSHQLNHHTTTLAGNQAPFSTNSDTETESEDDEQDEGKSRRRARSRRPQNLPFLSSPQPNSPTATSLSALTELSLSMSDHSLPSPSTPYSGHQLTWQHLYACSLDAEQQTSVKKAQVAVPLAPQQIVSAVIEVQRQLYVHMCWNRPDPFASHGEKNDNETKKLEKSDSQEEEVEEEEEAAVNLWHLWSCDSIRTACGGRITALVDALHLRPSAGPTVIATDGNQWDLRVLLHDPNLDSDVNENVHPEPDLYLVYRNRSQVGLWASKIKEAKNWVPKRNSLLFTHRSSFTSTSNKRFVSQDNSSILPQSPKSWD